MAINHFSDSRSSHIVAFPSDISAARRSSAPPRDMGAKKKAFVAKGHDAQLKEAQNEGYFVTLTTMLGERFEGKIIRRDRYTVTLKSSANGVFTDEVATIYYKHGIISLTIRKPV